MTEPKSAPMKTLSSAMVRAVLLLSLIAVLPSAVSAQYFGRNKVQYESFDFNVLKTNHFDIHFYPSEHDAVIDAARMGERWYERLARTFQHEFESPKPVILYADHPDFQQTNTLSGFINEGTGGVTESLKNRVIMPLGESYAATDHVLGHELVHAFQYNIAQSRAGGGLQGLYRLPLWLIEGMAEYLSVGREDALTAMWLRDAVRRDDLPTISQMTRESRFFPYRFGQALWAYIGGTYGDDAVIQLFRSALRVGWEPSINQILGTSSDSLSARWRRSVEEAYLPLMADRIVPGEIGTRLLGPDNAGSQNIAPSLSPDGRFVAFISEKDLFSFDLFIADARTGEVVRKLSSANADAHFDALRFIDSSGAWSPDGSKLMFIVFADGDNGMVIVDTESGDVLDRVSVPEVGSITSPAWSPDGLEIAFSGTAGGMTDIYIHELESGSTRQMTFDRHGDFQPEWSPDGNTIAFSTDRGPETNFDRLTYGYPQLALLDVASGDLDVLTLFGNVKHMNPQYAPDGESLYFISDVDGFSDVYRLTLATEEVHRITKVATAVSGITGLAPAMSVANDAGTMAFSVFDEFEFHIYTLDVTSGSPERVSLLAAAIDTEGRFLPPAEPEFSSRVGRYLEDWSTGLQTADAMVRIEDYSSGLQLDYVGQPSFGVAADRYGTYIGGGAAAYFSDMLGDRRLGVAVQANGTFKDIGGQVFYQNMKHRWNWGVTTGRTPLNYTRSAIRYNPNGTQDVLLLRQRLFIDQLGGMLAYPLTQTRRVEMNGGFTRYSYDYEQETFVTDPFGQVIDRQKESLPSPPPLNLTSASVALVGDNSFFGFTSPIRGGRSRFEVGATVGTVDYWTLTIDWRKYFNPMRNLTVAFRGLHIGRYGSQIEQTNQIQPFFIGYETLVRGYANESFQARECAVTNNPGNNVGVVGCPVWENLFGHRIGVANAEVRVPFFGTEQFGLINLPYLPTELLLFADAGVAWDGTRCQGLEEASCSPSFTFSSVVDGTTPQPVFSGGASARMNILGFMILEAYYAYPFQRPIRGWHWGFNLAAGW